MRLKSLTMKEIVRSDTADETAKVFFFRGNKLLSSEVNAEDFNSLLVLMFGFPIVATSYFVMIYTHNAVVKNGFPKMQGFQTFPAGCELAFHLG